MKMAPYAVVLFTLMTLVPCANAYPARLYCSVRQGMEHGPTNGTIWYSDVFEIETDNFKFPDNREEIVIPKAFQEYISQRYGISIRELGMGCSFPQRAGTDSGNHVEKDKADDEQRSRNNHYEVVETGWTYKRP